MNNDIAEPVYNPSILTEISDMAEQVQSKNTAAVILNSVLEGGAIPTEKSQLELALAQRAWKKILPYTV